MASLGHVTSTCLPHLECFSRVYKKRAVQGLPISVETLPFSGSFSLLLVNFHQFIEGEVLSYMEKSWWSRGENSSISLCHKRPHKMAANLWDKDKQINGGKTYNCLSSDNSRMVPNSPVQAMNFLSRSWSPSSTDFLQFLSSTAMSSPIEGSTSDGTVPEIEEDSSILEGSAPTVNTENLWVFHSSNGSRGPSRYQASIQKNWLGNMKSWLTKDLISRGSTRRKEQHRLQIAEIHAALSITQLSAAIAGFVAKGGLHHQTIHGNSPSSSTSEGKMWKKEMGLAMASAAALVAAVCAEAAESVGAARARITSIIGSAFAVATADEMAALTATAATCLRGASTLRWREGGRRYMLEYEELLARGARLVVFTPTGKTQKRKVMAFLRRKQLILKLGNDHFWRGLITTFKEYTIIDAKGGVNESSNGVITSIILSTSRGTICLMFEDEKVLNIWTHAISCILASLKKARDFNGFIHNGCSTSV